MKLAGALGTSAPVFDSAGVLGSVTVTIPQVRFRRTMGPRIQDLVTHAAHQVSRVLGYRDGPETGAPESRAPSGPPSRRRSP